MQTNFDRQRAVSLLEEATQFLREYSGGSAMLTQSRSAKIPRFSLRDNAGMNFIVYPDGGGGIKVSLLDLGTRLLYLKSCTLFSTLLTSDSFLLESSSPPLRLLYH